MEQIVLIFHVLAALAITGLILLQQGKGADVGASFGAGASQTLFGSGGSGNVLTKATALLAAFFFCTSLGLAVLAKQRSGSAEAMDLPVPAVVETRRAPVQEEEADIPETVPGPAQRDAPAADDIPAAPAKETE